MENSEGIGQRIEILVNKLAKGNNSLFASNIGTSEANVRNYINGRLPKYDTLLKIVTYYDVSADWLITGRGEMFNNTEGYVSKESNATIILLMDEIKTSNQEIGFLKKTVEALTEENKQLKEKLKQQGDKKEAKVAAPESHAVHT